MASNFAGDPDQRIPMVPGLDPSMDPNNRTDQLELTPDGQVQATPLPTPAAPPSAPAAPVATGDVQDGVAQVDGAGNVTFPGAPAPVPPPVAQAPDQGMVQGNTGDHAPGLLSVPTSDGGSVKVAVKALQDPALAASLRDRVGPRAGNDADKLQAKEDQAERDFYEGNATVAKAKAGAIAAETDVKVAQQNENYRLMQQEEAQKAQQDALYAQKEKDNATVIQQHADALTQLRGEQAKMTFDPDHYQKSQSFGSRMMTALSVALGGIGQGLNGGRNVGEDLLRNAIEQDVQSQKIAYQRMGDRIGAAQGAYAQAKQKGLDDHGAYLAAKVAIHDQAQQAMQVVGAKYAPQATQAAAKMLAANMMGDQQKLMTEFGQHAQQNAKQIADARHAERVYAAGRSDEQFNRAARTEQIAIQAGETQAKQQATARDTLDIPGWKGTIKTKEAYTKATDLVGSERDTSSAIDALIAFRKKYGNEVLDREAKAVADSIKEQLVLAQKNSNQLGVMSDSDAKLLNRMVGDPTGFGSNDAVISTLESLKKRTVQATDNKLDTYGLRRDRTYKPPQEIVENDIPGGTE